MSAPAGTYERTQRTSPLHRGNVIVSPP
jgi:hypothetical protein